MIKQRQNKILKVLLIFAIWFEVCLKIEHGYENNNEIIKNMINYFIN